jgi:hypothetical protein
MSYVRRIYRMGMVLLGCEKLETSRIEPVPMEPETHIELYGIDHYIRTVFVYDTAKQRVDRRNYLLSFECLRKKQELFLSRIRS